MKKPLPPDVQVHNVPDSQPRVWDDLGILLAVSTVGSFAKAEPVLGINQATIGRRIAQLEQSLGVELLRRSTQGVVLTAVGKSIAREAEQMDYHANKIHKIARGDHKGSQRTVNLASSDGIAKYILAPHAGELRERSPATFVAFNCTHVQVDLEKNHADLVIGFQPYTSFDIVNGILGWLHMYPFAAPEYLEKHGCPKTTSDLNEHTLVDHLAYGLDEADWGLWQGLEPVGVPFSANQSSVHFELIRSGVGIGLLPNYGFEKPGIRYIDIGFKLSMPIYLSYPKRLRRSNDIRPVIDWVRWVFSKKYGKWFRQEFSESEYFEASA